MPAADAVSPLAPCAFPAMPPVRGVRLATGAAQIRYRDRDDVLLVAFPANTAVAGVFTQSQTAAAPVLWCRSALVRGRARALLVNAGNANAFTGRAGEQAVERTVIAAAGQFACATDEVFVASTGVIGELLPAQRICDLIPHLADRLDEQNDSDDWRRAAAAIATTDTFPKGTTATARIDGVAVTISGIAKGAGMIAPDMATMLAFVFTDAAIAPAALQTLLRSGADRSFNAITIDGDTSTNDTLLMFATGAAPHDPINTADDPRLGPFIAALDGVLLDLAQQIVRDGEGASKFVTVRVSGAADDGAARRIALTIANSPLVKTAIAGADANWGRIVMAVGKAGERIDRNRLEIAIGGVVVAREGGAPPGYDEAPVSRHMQGREVEIAVDVGVGGGAATVWTCDLTHGYIDVNASYRS
ncbi:MAG: bifunctional glutamate N-acetyltransferase/amino-acid acetyltransferase ArgJ [Rhodospirillales bacterium]|jgi:glutamate N-acetyltransferase/amino-acid N-acetyltransferase|nr:bifunctional glutamate N-acetyltransferase/amino-acid acetyltransferase ArgJ [Rhodospirillales bacterium]